MYGARTVLILGCLGTALSCALVGCEGAGGQAERWKAESGARRIAPVQWNTLWTKGGSEADTTVIMPTALAADPELVVVTEPAIHRVTALRVRDGRVAWRISGPGGGPREVRNPMAVAFGAGGEVFVLDQGNGRVLAVDRATGEPFRHVSLQDNGYPVGLCPLPDGSLLLSTVGSTHPLAHVAHDGETIARRSLPWPDLENVGTLPQQGFLAPDPAGGGCVYALRFGRGLVRFAAGRFRRPSDYVEAFDLPRSTQQADSGGRRENLGKRTEAARAVAADSQTIAVGFVGRSDDGGRLIDLYSADDGAYRETLRAPFWFDRLTRAGDVYVFVTRRDGYPALVAARAVEAGGADGAR